MVQAFCQSEPLDRPQGDIYVESCQGLGLDPGTLILVAPGYGLDDAPIRWHQTIVSFFTNLGFHRTLLESCWLVKRDAKTGKILAMVLIEVDDLNIATVPEYKETLLKELTQRFEFGKVEHDEADFAGRRVCFTKEEVLTHQEKYSLEKLHTLKLETGRKGDKLASLSPEEFEAFRSMLYKVSWVAQQT